MLLAVLDFAGTFVFALSGAFKGVRRGLDYLGITVLAVLTGVGGGIVRDVLLGATPPAVFRDERYLAICLGGAVAVLLFGRTISKTWNRVMLADAIGLGLFAAMGAAKGASFGLGPLGTIFCGALTAVGGGVIRDVLVGDRPAVLYKGYYATAAIIGAALLVFLGWLGVGETTRVAAAAITTSTLRLVELARNARSTTD